MAKRALAVARVSTKAQDPERQLVNIREYCERHGYVLVGEPIRDKVSGTVEIRDREGGRELYSYIDGINRGQADVVVFDAIDRVARDDEVAEFVILRRDVHRAGMELHFFDVGATPADPIGGIVGYIHAAMAANERQNIARRNLEGRRLKARRGQWVGVGAPPYGFTTAGQGKHKVLQIDPDEARVVRYIFALYLGLEGHAAEGLNTIARRLQAEGIPSPSALVARGTRPTVGGWTPRMVRLILTRPMCLGIFRYSGITVHLPDLALVPTQWYDAAQAQLEARRPLVRRNRKHDYLLASLITCRCGGGMYARTEVRTHGDKTWTYRLYACAREARAASTCREPRVAQRDADALVWDWLTRWAKGHERLPDASEIADTRLAVTGETLEAKLLAVTEDARRTEGELKRLVTRFAALTGPGAGIVAAEVERLNAQLVAYQEEREKVKRALNDTQAGRRAREALTGAREALAEDLERLTTCAQRREALAALGLRVRLVADARSPQGRGLALELERQGQRVPLGVTLPLPLGPDRRRRGERGET